MAALDAWDSFYVIVGSSAGTLIGLQFVVMTLIAERPPRRAAEASTVFGTPTVVHFGTALLLSALLRAPWPGIAGAAAATAFVGVGGLVYTLLTTRRMHVQTAYAPDFEDWLCHALLPLIAYAALPASAFAALSLPREGLFGMGGATLLLLFIGIHNAWDSVAFLVFTNRRNAENR
jgi:energy-converting hydrogenase Eha subunit A